MRYGGLYELMEAGGWRTALLLCHVSVDFFSVLAMFHRAYDTRAWMHVPIVCRLATRVSDRVRRSVDGYRVSVVFLATFAKDLRRRC
jgi:hypothetical protein